MDDGFVTGGAARGTAWRRTTVDSDARATLHGGHSPRVTQARRGKFSAPFFCLLFFGKDAPKEVPLGDKEKQVPPRTGATPINQYEIKERQKPKTQNMNAAKNMAARQGDIG